MRILVVEDEVRLADALSQILRQQGYLVDAVYDGQDGLSYALTGQYDGIVLDVMLPKRDGFSIARALRSNKLSTPILMLTARDELSDKVAGLDCGADDYMTKPFAPEELLARIRALTRRSGEVQLETLTFGDLTLNLTNHDLCCNTRNIRLGQKEFEVLRILMSSPKAVVQKEELIVKVWGTETEASDNNVEAYISFLRKKFYHLGSKVGISTVRKLGYQLESGEDTHD